MAQIPQSDSPPTHEAHLMQSIDIRVWPKILHPPMHEYVKGCSRELRSIVLFTGLVVIQDYLGVIA